ncbi:hypothetical protein [Marinomonas sp. THO17]|uniref:hypothetical protein n=1 Tax=Marinomonas sp. THO17 TaxID=3149048 RepID=UPI00336BD775
MSQYETLYEFDHTWKITQLVIKRALEEVQVSLTATFAQQDNSITLEFTRLDDPQNLIELIDFRQITISQEQDTQRDFSTIKVELFCDGYSEFWCDAVDLK